MAQPYEPLPGTPFDPKRWVAGCIEAGCPALLLDADALPPAFFRLETGAAGELLHELSKYRLRLAAVVPEPARHPARFQEFVAESNRGRQARFFADRGAALEWLASDSRGPGAS